eukprot:jgi/Undpi1/1755/HiC_scaffold_11.g05144.m1
MTMRGARNGGGVSIEGAGGETRRVKRSRRSDLRAMERIGLQAAAVVVNQPKIDVNTELARSDTGSVDGEQAVSDTSDTSENTISADRLSELESLASKYAASEDRDLVEEVSSGAYFDKHTKLYVPTDGIIVKKTYGFWTWQAFGFIFVQHFIRSLIRKGGDVSKTAMAEINWDHVVTEPEHLKELKAYCCDECGYTLFPARGRHEHFFDDVDDFKCPECDAPRSSFYDANDPDDPHNQRDGEGEVTNLGVVASATNDTEPSAASTPSTPEKAPSQNSSDSAADSSSRPANDEREEAQDDDADLLDF